ncbi:UNVERIFIED_CONTAM: Clathrin interactor EPSIN 3 [Sesamum radiatum]|uniref:Clathrin interactor EPSIN 3 n=1 Tax=Sesamum radiatum TaxID=300843 RepID=A0AAW2SJ14_SESRA
MFGSMEVMFSAAPTTSNGTAPATSGVEMDLLGSLSESFSANPLALVPASPPTMTPEANATASFNSDHAFAAASSPSMINNQPFDDPFGDGPFRAVPSTESASVQQQVTTSTNSFATNSIQTLDVPQQVPQKAPTEFGGTFYDGAYMQSGASGVQPPASPQFAQHELSNTNLDIDILADILPPSASASFVNPPAGYSVPPSQSVSHGGFPQANQPTTQSALPSLTAHENSFQSQTSQPAGFPTQLGQPSLQTNYSLQSAESVSQKGFATQAMALTFPVQANQASQMGFHAQSGSTQPNLPNPNFYGTYHSQPVSTGPAAPYMVPPSSTGPTTQHNLFSQSGSAVPIASQMGPQSPQMQPSSLMAAASTNPSLAGSSAIVPQSSKDKFETKSTVWADTLSRGLVNLNISGPKTNPLADIGVDFDAINRKRKRMEKPTTTTVTSTVTMGKAMGSGSGMGRAGAGALRPLANSMVGSGVNIGMSGGPGAPMGMGGYGGMNMQQQAGFPPGSAVPGGYNHTMGTGNYGQQPYGGGYR